MLVQLLIRVNRLDVAQQQLEVMHSLGEDHTMTQLAEAWLSMALVE